MNRHLRFTRDRHRKPPLEVADGSICAVWTIHGVSREGGARGWEKTRIETRDGYGRTSHQSSPEALLVEGAVGEGGRVVNMNGRG